MRGSRVELVVVLLGTLCLAGTAHAVDPVCGNGIVEGSEECDPGGGMYCDGDPANQECQSGGECSGSSSNCFYRFSCCKFNCQVVGQGELQNATCTDGQDDCTLEDRCLTEHPTTGEKGVCFGDAVPEHTACNEIVEGECRIQDRCDAVGICQDGENSAGSPCSDDGNACTDDLCGSQESCTHPPSVSGSSCDDGLFCTATDRCDGSGSCVGAEDPCSAGGECGTSCNEAEKNCHNPFGTVCTADANQCTADVCDGAGQCAHPALEAGEACDDDLFCTGTDLCDGAGACQGAGNPCADGAECATVCNEAVDTCAEPQGQPCGDDGAQCTDDVCDGAGACSHPARPAGVACTDGLFCSGPDLCDGQGTCAGTGNPCGDGVCANVCNEETHGCVSSLGLPCADDENVCTEDVCDAEETCLHNVLVGPCDDDNVCTRDDQCLDSQCTGSYGVTGRACDWVAIGRDDRGSAKLQALTSSTTEGDACGDTILLRSDAVISDDLVAMEANGIKAMRMGPFCDVGHDVVTAGAGVKTVGKDTDLPRLEDVDGLEPGAFRVKDDASGTYNLTGAHALVGHCADSQSDLVSLTSAVQNLPSNANLGSVRLNRQNQVLRITAVDPGGINVVDFDKIILGKNGRIELDAGGDPDTVLILRVHGKYATNINSDMVALGGLLPQNTLIFSDGRRCQIGKKNTGFGTVACMGGPLQLREASTWVGALLGGSRLLRIGERATLLYEPFTAF